MKLVEAQLLQQLGWVLRDHAKIVSGAYKIPTRQVNCGTDHEGVTQWRSLTDEEKLKDAMATMEAHLKFVCECVDYIGEHKDEPEEP